MRTITTFLLFLGMALAHELACSDLEKYNQCGPSCQRTCQNLNETISCLEVCTPGCFCLPGYVRIIKGSSCVQTSSCAAAPQCPDNAEYKATTICPATCADPTPTCLSLVIVQRCVCVSGFVFDVAGGVCVPLDSCVAN